MSYLLVSISWQRPHKLTLEQIPCHWVNLVCAAAPTCSDWQINWLFYELSCYACQDIYLNANSSHGWAKCFGGMVYYINIKWQVHASPFICVPSFVGLQYWQEEAVQWWKWLQNMLSMKTLSLVYMTQFYSDFRFQISFATPSIRSFYF